MSQKYNQKNHSNSAESDLDYFTERGGFVVRTDHGWISYYIINTEAGKIAYLENMFIKKNSRRAQNGTALLNRFEMEIVEIMGVKSYYTTINRVLRNSNVALIGCLKRGLILQSVSSDAYYLTKEL